MKKLDHSELHDIFEEMLIKAPSKNEKELESKYPLYLKELEETIGNIPEKTLGMKPGMEALNQRVFWKDGARCHPVRGTIRGYSFAEIIAGCGGDGLYCHDKFRLGKNWQKIYPGLLLENEDNKYLIKYVIFESILN